MYAGIAAGATSNKTGKWHNGGLIFESMHAAI